MTACDLVVLDPISPVYAIHCPHCLRAERQKCLTETGKPRKYVAHVARWDLAMHLIRNREMWHMLRADDSRFGLAAGDIIRTLDYPWGAKVSVLFRESDGFEPGCNQYLGDVLFLGFVPTDMELTR